jgi:hypothetical protein
LLQVRQQFQLAYAAGLRMGGDDLLHQRGAGARHAGYEYRCARRVARRCQLGKARLGEVPGNAGGDLFGLHVGLRLAGAVKPVGGVNGGEGVVMVAEFLECKPECEVQAGAIFGRDAIGLRAGEAAADPVGLRFSAEVLEEILGDEQAQRGIGGVGGKGGVYLGAGILAACTCARRAPALSTCTSAICGLGSLILVPRGKGCLDVSGGVLPSGQFGEVGGLFCSALATAENDLRRLRVSAQCGQRVRQRARGGVILGLCGMYLAQQAQVPQGDADRWSAAGPAQGRPSCLLAVQGHDWACVLALHLSACKQSVQTAVCPDGDQAQGREHSAQRPKTKPARGEPRTGL